MGSSRGTSPAGELQSSSHNVNLIVPYASEKIAYGLQITCTNFFREKMHFLRTGADKRLDAYKTPHPAATGQVDVVGGFKVVAAVVLSQFCAETDRRYAVAGVVLAPLFINVVELLGTDGVRGCGKCFSS